MKEVGKQELPEVSGGVQQNELGIPCTEPIMPIGPMPIVEDPLAPYRPDPTLINPVSEGGV